MTTRSIYKITTETLAAYLAGETSLGAVPTHVNDVSVEKIAGGYYRPFDDADVVGNTLAREACRDFAAGRLPARPRGGPTTEDSTLQLTGVQTFDPTDPEAMLDALLDLAARVTCLEGIVSQRDGEGLRPSVCHVCGTVCGARVGEICYNAVGWKD